MRFFSRLFLAAACLFASAGLAAAHDYELGGLHIEHPWTRATTASNGVGYTVIENHGKNDDKLVSASSPAAEMIMLHTHIMDGEVMKMRMVEAVEIPAGGKAELKPGSFHLMMMGLKAPFKEGDMVPVTLTFAKAGSIEVKLKVEAAGAAATDHSH